VAAAVDAIAGGPGESSPASSPVEKKWSKDTIMGRYMLISECRVPTTYVQSANGMVRSGANKGKAAQNRGKTIGVAEASVKAVLGAIAIWDKKGNSKTNWPSNGRIAFRTGLGVATVNSAVRVLTQAGWLWKTPRGNVTNSKRCHLEWDLIEGSHEKYVPKKKTFEEYAGPASKPNIQATAPLPAAASRAAAPPSAINRTPDSPPKIQKPGESSFTIGSLVYAVMERLEMHNPKNPGALPQAIEIVLKQLCKLHEAKDILAAIAGMKDWQWRAVSNANNQAGFMRTALDNSLKGLTEEQVRDLRPKHQEDEEDDEQLEEDDEPDAQDEDEEVPDEEEDEDEDQDEQAEEDERIRKGEEEWQQRAEGERIKKKEEERERRWSGPTGWIHQYTAETNGSLMRWPELDAK
jgi:hypothetical protein